MALECTLILQADYLTPRGIYICDGSEEEAAEIIHKLEERGTLEKLEKMENWYAVIVNKQRELFFCAFCFLLQI